MLANGVCAGPLITAADARGIESRAVAGADELPTGRIVVHRAAGVGAGRVKGHELAAQRNLLLWLPLQESLPQHTVELSSCTSLYSS